MSFCTNCGNQLRPGSKFCEKCGHKVEGASIHQNVRNQSESGNKRLLSSAIRRLNNYLGNDNPADLNWKVLFTDVFKKHTDTEGETVFISGTATTTPDIHNVTDDWPHPWLYSRVLCLFCLAYLLLRICVDVFENANALPGMIVVGSFAVPLATMVLFIELNVWRDVSFYKIIKIFLLGGCASLFATLILFSICPVDELDFFGAIMVGVIEELGKMLIVLIFLRKMQNVTILSGMLVGAAVGAGFAAFESAGYALKPLIGFMQYAGYAAAYGHSVDSQEMIDGINEIIFLRGMLAPGGHVTWAAITGAALSIASKDTTDVSQAILKKKFLRLFAIPVVLHAIWDSPLSGVLNEIIPYSSYVLLVLIVWIVTLILINMGLSEVNSAKGCSDAPDVNANVSESHKSVKPQNSEEVTKNRTVLGKKSEIVSNPPKTEFEAEKTSKVKKHNSEVVTDASNTKRVKDTKVKDKNWFSRNMIKCFMVILSVLVISIAVYVILDSQATIENGELISVNFKFQGHFYIDDDVSVIGNNAFYSCDGLTGVTIPNSVTKIGDEAFEYCTMLKEVSIPNSVTDIGEFAFEKCASLTSVTIPNSVTIIGRGAFSGCESLETVILPNNISSIKSSTFYECSALTKVLIPNSVVKIEESAFCGCENLKELTIPNSVTSIGESAFASCKGLVNITIPKSVKRVGRYAFNDCENLTSITFLSREIDVAADAFNGCESLSAIYVPAGSSWDYEFMLYLDEDKIVEQ